jgi:hypothetical protein
VIMPRNLKLKFTPTKKQLLAVLLLSFLILSNITPPPRLIFGATFERLQAQTLDVVLLHDQNSFKTLLSDMKKTLLNQRLGMFFPMLFLTPKLGCLVFHLEIKFLFLLFGSSSTLNSLS